LLTGTIESVGLDDLNSLVIRDLQTIWRNAISTANRVRFLTCKTGVVWWIFVSVLMGGASTAERIIVRVVWFQINARVDVT
jgi:hypothetical protein